MRVMQHAAVQVGASGVKLQLRVGAAGLTISQCLHLLTVRRIAFYLLNMRNLNRSLQAHLWQEAFVQPAQPVREHRQAAGLARRPT